MKSWEGFETQVEEEEVAPVFEGACFDEETEEVGEGGSLGVVEAKEAEGEGECCR